MHRDKLHYRHNQKSKICRSKNLLVSALFLIFFLLPGESWAPPFGGGRVFRPPPPPPPIHENIRSPSTIEYGHQGSDHPTLNTESLGIDPPRLNTESLGSDHPTLNTDTFWNTDNSKIEIITSDEPADKKSALEKLEYTGKDARIRFQADYGLKGQSNIESAAQTILDTRENGLSLESITTLYTIFPGKVLGSSFRYILVDKKGKFVNKSNNIKLIRKSLNHNHGKEVYLDVTRFTGDRQIALLHSLSLGNMADGEAHFRPITWKDLPTGKRPEALELLFSSKPSLEIPKDDAIVAKKGHAEVIIPGATYDKKPFVLHLQAKTKKALRLFLAYLRNIFSRPPNDLIGLVGAIELARHEFAKRYPQYDIKAEVHSAAGATQIVEYIDNQKLFDFLFASIISWIHQPYKRV